MLNKEETKKLIEAFQEKAGRLEERALDATDKRASKLREEAAALRQKASELKGERVPTRRSAH